MLALAAPGVACAPQRDPPGPALAPPVLGQESFTAADGRILATVRHDARAPRAVVVAAHGFNDYSNAFHLVGPWLAERSISVVAVDQRGFGDTPTRGLWAGADAMAGDLAALTRAVRDDDPDLPVYLLGASMGAAVAVLAVADHGAPADGMILSGPAFWGWSAMNPVYRASLWTAAHTVPAWRLTGEGLGRRPSDNDEMLRALSRDPKVIRATRVDTIYGLVTLMEAASAAAPRVHVPTLVLFGARDEIVPEAPAREAARRLGGPVRYVRYADGWHMLLRDTGRETVYADVAAWLADPQGPLPSGEELALSPESGHDLSARAGRASQ